MEYNNRLFNELKSIEESLEDRYTSSQLIQILDKLINRAIKPVVRDSPVYEEFAATLLSWYSSSSRRKISRSNRDHTIQSLALSFSVEGMARYKVVRDIELERNLLFFLVTLYLERAKEFLWLEQQLGNIPISKSRRRQKILNQLELRGRTLGTNVGPNYFECLAWLTQASLLRNKIIEKYTRHALNRANSYYKTAYSGLSDRVDLSDLVQNFLLGVNKAISKFDPKKGALTSYINNWLRDAQTSSGFEHEFGIAYQFPPTMRRSYLKPINVYTSIDLHNDSSTNDDEDRKEALVVDKILVDSDTPQTVNELNSTVHLVRKLCRHADPLGLARLQLGIEEELDKNELQQLTQVAAMNDSS